MLLEPQFWTEQILNSLQFSMLLFLLAIGLSVVFGLMDYLNLSHGTIYMFAAYVAFSITQRGGSFWAALAVAPLIAAAVGLAIYFVLLKRAEKLGHLTQVLLTVGVIYMGTDLLRIGYGDLPKGVEQPELLSGAVNLFGIPYPSYRLFIIALGLAVMAVLYVALDRTRLGALVRARAAAETLGIDIATVFTLVFGIGTYLAGIAGVVAAPLFGVYPGMDVSIIILVLIVVVVGGLGSLRGVIVGSLLIGFADTFGKILLPQFATIMIYLVMALVLIFRLTGLMPARRLSGMG